MTHFTERITSVASREALSPDVLQKRLLLALCGLGTNTGLKRMAHVVHDTKYADLRYIWRRYLHKEQLRAAIAEVVNATLRVCQTAIWGDATTSCASDSKKFGTFDQNLVTRWHARYRGPGVLIYWHVDRRSMCIYSQHPEDYPNIQLILTRPINWDLIKQQYDQMMKYATALRLGTADADAILRRFAKQNTQHLTYLALLELGRAIKTIFSATT